MKKLSKHQFTRIPDRSPTECKSPSLPCISGNPIQRWLKIHCCQTVFRCLRNAEVSCSLIWLRDSPRSFITDLSHPARNSTAAERDLESKLNCERARKSFRLLEMLSLLGAVIMPGWGGRWWRQWCRNLIGFLNESIRPCTWIGCSCMCSEKPVVTSCEIFKYLNVWTALNLL